MADDKESQVVKLSLAELRRRIDELLNDYLKDKSPETIGTYRRSLMTFQEWFAQPGTNFHFGEEDVREYKRYLTEERELSQVSVSTYLTALRRLCQYMVDAGHLEKNPASEVKGNRRPSSHSRTILTEEDISALKEQVSGSSLIDRRDRAMVYLMLYAGLSEIEIVRADHEDLERTLMGWYLRVQSKGRTVKDQSVPLDDEVADTLNAYLEKREGVKPDSPLLVSHGHRSRGNRLNTRSIRSRINKHLKESGIKRPGLTPHSLTHTAPLIWLNRGMDVEEVKERMRHGSLDTTMIHYKKKGLLKRDPEELKDIGQ